MTNSAARSLANLRWSKEPTIARVGHSGGRPKLYPQCPERKTHRFNPKTNLCYWCNANRTDLAEEQCYR